MFLRTAVVFLFSLNALAQSVEISPPQWVIAPGSDELKGLQINTANNNLNIFAHNGRLYLAFRTATHHHPKPPSWAPKAENPTTRMHILSAPLKDVDWSDLNSAVANLKWNPEFEVHAAMSTGMVMAATQDIALAKGKGESFDPQWVKKLYGEEVYNEYKESVLYLHKEKDIKDKVLAPITAPTSLDTLVAELFQEFDIREPFFFELGGKLYFYFQQVRGKANTFKSLRTWAMVLEKDGWSNPQPVLEPKSHFWDIKVREGVAYMTSYSGGHYNRNSDREQTEIRFRKSSDGLNWEEIGDKAPAYYGGANEAAITFDKDGNLYGILRNEDGGYWSNEGGVDGWGSISITASKDDLKTWKPHAEYADPRRYDSPRLFTHGEDIYLVARQNIGAARVDEDYHPFDNTLSMNLKRVSFFKKALPFGNFDFPKLSRLISEDQNYPFDMAFVDRNQEIDYENGELWRTLVIGDVKTGDRPNKSDNPQNMGVFQAYETHYYGTLPKRTALYKRDAETGTYEIVETLPSSGDTAFPSIVKLSETEYLVANYTSDFNSPETLQWSWGKGQENPTGIYFIKVTIKE